VKFRNEQAFTDAVIDLATMYGWFVHHDRGRMKSHIQGHVGFPDLVLVRRGQILFRELKMPNGKTTPEQEGWLNQLAGKVWRPADWDKIIDTLAGRGKPW
jgi:hypothetical protein